MVRDDFPRLVVRRWREMVRDDFRSRAISSKDEAVLEGDATPYSRYGTTLIAAIVTETNVIYAQIGDGDIVLLRADESYELLSPNDQNLVGGSTLSLAGDEAARRFSCGNSSVAGLRGLFLSTDGLRNCYEDDDAFVRLLSAIATMVSKEGIDLSLNVIREQFVQFSRNGSGDDITLAAVILPINAEEETSVPKNEDVTIENTKIKDRTGVTPDGTNNGN